MSKVLKIVETPDLKAAFSVDLLGKAIQAKRTQSHLRLEDAASLCGVAKQTLMKIEHGHKSVQLNSLLKVCAGLGIKLQIVSWDKEAIDDWQ
jgi:transcriptional regulator with XRE-family HTH domain